MALTRYKNEDLFFSDNVITYGRLFDILELSNLDSSIMYPTFTSLNAIPDEMFPEVHIYTFQGDLLASNYAVKIDVDDDTKSLIVDIAKVFKVAAIDRGSYKLAINILSPIWGRPAPFDNKDWPVFVKEFAPDRTEIKLSISNAKHIPGFEDFKEYIERFSNLDLLNNVVINFGNNHINKILNIRFDEQNPTIFYVKLYQPVHEYVSELDNAWFAIELMDSYLDTIVLTSEEVKGITRRLKGPNFNVDFGRDDSSATLYKTYNELLDGDTEVKNEIFDRIITGSGQATLNIDYTDFENFVHFSRAQDRMEIFYEKVKKIEDYNTSLETVLQLNSSESAATINQKEIYSNRIAKIKSSFDPFEKWLYYHDTGSLTTHGFSGSVVPYPKYVSASKVHIHPTGSSETQTWYNEQITASIEYDYQNMNSLWWSIPEHVLMDQGNSIYVTFVNMIGQQFDNQYAFIDSLTKIHEKDEHPELGPSNDLLWHIAKSFGWHLQNNRSLSSLWLYKLGTNSQGEEVFSSGMKVLPHERQTQMIWRRIINNLPYLYKTKGTPRSIKALMSIFGIPKTVISIKEYGGPGIDQERPIASEERFGYRLGVGTDFETWESHSYLRIYQDELDVYSWGWGNGRWCGGVPVNETTSSTLPRTYEFRFSTLQSSSNLPITLFNSTYDSSSKFRIELHSSTYLSESISGSDDMISGSYNYGKLHFYYGNDYSGSTGYIPIFDGDMWTVKLEKSGSVLGETGSISIDVGRADDNLYGRIVHTASMSFPEIHNIDEHFLFQTTGSRSSLALGGDLHTSLQSSYTPFHGYIQAYKEYYTTYSTQTYREHIQNPGAYHVDSISGSFYSLYKYLPLGIDQQRWDVTQVSSTSGSFSSHPDRSLNTFPTVSVDYVNFQGTQDDIYDTINETFYIQVPKLGDSVLASEKIRLEDIILRNELSPEMRSNISEFDEKGMDSERLAIVFSLADQINRDIYNHMGFENIDKWVGDPEEEFGEYYTELASKRNEYFRKYTQNNDINAFIRILSLYDYTFFDQVKQLAPARADLITGILIEPHVLERSKVKISDLPEVSNPQWDDTIGHQPSWSGLYPTYEGEIKHSESVDISPNYETGSINPQWETEFHPIYETGSIDRIFEATSTLQQSKDRSGSFVVVDWDNHTGSINTLIEDHRTVCAFKRKEDIYDSWLEYESLTKDPFFNDYLINAVNYSSSDASNDYMPTSSNGTGSYYIYPSLDITSSLKGKWYVSQSANYHGHKLINTFGLANEYNHKVRFGLRMKESMSIAQKIEIESGSEYIGRFLIYTDISSSQNLSIQNPITRNLHSYLNIKLSTGSLISDSVSTETYSNYMEVDVYPNYYKHSGSIFAREYRIPFSSSESGSHWIELNQVGSSSIEYYLCSFEVHKKVSKWDEGWAKRAYDDLDIPVTNKLEDWYYQYYNCSKAASRRFYGSKLTGPGVNIDSPNTVDGGPVVEITTVNPEQLGGNDGDGDGNLRVT